MAAMYQTIFFVLVIFAAFYFVLVKPVQDTNRKQRRDVASLQVGDEVLTSAGFLASVHEIQEREDGRKEFTLDLGNGILVRALSTAIAQRLTAEESGSA